MITKAEWERSGGLRSPNTFRKQGRTGRWTYWRIF